MPNPSAKLSLAGCSANDSDIGAVTSLSLKDKSSDNSKAASKPNTGPKLTATSQTSRFHVDTLSTLSQEIDLHQVNISVGLNDLLIDSHLRLKSGVHYALVGRNGEGKSTLLKAIADKLIPGLPDNLRILLVSQVHDEDEKFSLAGDDDREQHDPGLTVTQRVVKSDRRRERAMKEQQLLLKAHESSSSSAIPEAVFSVRLSRAQDELEDARKIALKRSGTRGSEARKQLLKAEATVAEYEERLASADWGIDDLQVSLEATGLLLNVQSTLDSLDAGTTEARARSILLGLGFKQEQLDAKFKTLSGGWRSRCSLANSLLQQPDVLLLDEPTNYLDIMSVIWLQNYLDTISSTVVVVGHDREFIDATAQETIVLRNKTLSYFDGNLTESERHARTERKGKIRQKEAMDKKRSAIEKSIEKGVRTAKKTGDENRMKMVKSRQKKLDERWGMEKTDKGTRFKRNRDMVGKHLTSRRELEIDELDRPVKLSFPSPEPMRFPGALISANNISFAYPGSAEKVLDGVSLTIHPGARVGLVGKNGGGKSTLVKLLIGILRPHKGSVEQHSRLRLGYFDQHSVEILSVPEVATSSAYDHLVEQLKKKHSIAIDEHAGRSFLGSFGLHGRTATNPIGTLSGGQKVRLALALVVYPAPDLLVLDEATTHLDKDTIVALVRALRKYTGAVLLVSHDRHFIRCVIEGASVLPPSSDVEDNEGDSDNESEDSESPNIGKVYAVGPKGRVKPLSGGTDDYVALVEKQMRKLRLMPTGG